MIRLYADQLSAQLRRSLHSCYLLFGNDPLLLQESQNSIRNRAKEQQFNEHFSVTLDSRMDWDMIFNLCQERSLFTSRQTLLVILPDSGIQTTIGKKMLYLASLLHDDLLLIIRGGQFTHIFEKTAWFQELSNNSVLVICSTPDQEQLLYWVARRAKSMKLMLDDDACRLLCYCYEGNLLALAQALERLSMIYPDGNLTLSRVNAAVNNDTRFIPFHWVESALLGNDERVTRILLRLRLNDADPVILLRGIQREVLQLLMLKRQMATSSIYMLFERNKVSKRRRILYIKALRRLSPLQLQDAVSLMTHIELTLKQDQNYSYSIWSDLNALALLLCGKTLPEAILNG